MKTERPGQAAAAPRGKVVRELLVRSVSQLSSSTLSSDPTAEAALHAVQNRVHVSEESLHVRRLAIVNCGTSRARGGSSR